MSNTNSVLLKLWFSSRKYGSYLSGEVNMTPKTMNDIKRDTGIKVSLDLPDQFTTCLKKFPRYANSIYRGVFKQDHIYLAFLANQTQVKLDRYYSCSKNKLIAQAFGDKILLVISGSKNFDVSEQSREEEIILDKNQTFTFVKSEILNDYTIIYIN